MSLPLSDAQSALAIKGSLTVASSSSTAQVLLARAGVRDVRLHDLRHTAASLLLAQGVHPRVVMELLGHSQIGLTMNTYSHVMPSLLRAAADSIEGTLWGDES